MEKRRTIKKLKLLFVIFFFILFTVMFSLFNLINSYNHSIGENKFINLLISEKENFFQIVKYDISNKKDFYNKKLVELTSNDINRMNAIVNSKGFEVYKIESDVGIYKDIYELLNIQYKYGYDYDAYTYQSDNVNVVNLSSEDISFNEKIIGNIPTNANEIMISNYIADLIINCGIKTYNNDMVTTDYYKFNNYEQLIDKNIYFSFNNKKVKISGIIDYDLSKYKVLKNKNWNDLDQEGLKLGDELIRKAKNDYSKIYVTQEFINNLKIDDSGALTGIMYNVQSKDSMVSIFKEFLKKDSDLYIETNYATDYYHILNLNSILKNIFLWSSIFCLIIILIMIITLLVSKIKYNLDFSIKMTCKEKVRNIFGVTIFNIILSSILYSLNILLFKNVICNNFVYQLNPFEFHIKQYVIIFFLPILVMISIFFIMLINKKLKKDKYIQKT